MKKTIYIVLLLIDVGLMVYTGYYIVTHPTVPASAVVATVDTEATSTPQELPKNIKTFPLTSGEKITVEETNPLGASLSTLTVAIESNGSTSPISLETDKVTNIFTADLNQDSFEELVIISTAQGSGSYGDAAIFTTKEKPNLTLVHIPIITENDIKKGGLFEGYLGHDSFSVASGTLVREYPIYNATDTNSSPTGATKKIYYTITEKDKVYSVTFSDSLATSTNTIQVTPKSASLPATTWVWTSSTQGGVTSKAPEGKFVLTFGGDMKFFSTTDCNNVFGTATSTKDTLQLKSTLATSLVCEGSKESVYASLLSKTKTYSITNNELTLVLGDKDALTFKKR